jgi:hypothetical protein
VNFWKYTSSFRKNNKDAIELEIDGNCLTQPCAVAETLATYFKSVFNNHCMCDFSTDFWSSHSLPIASISDSDVLKAIYKVHPSKSVGLDGIPVFIMKGCSDILIPVLKFISISAYHSKFSQPCGSKLPLFSFPQKGKTASVCNYRPTSILNTFSKIQKLEIIIH